jgi:hypothetical protein
MVVIGLIMIYVLLIFAPLYKIAGDERSSYGDLDAKVKTSFRKNLRRRGSIGGSDYVFDEKRRARSR